jgi:DNA-binding protein
MSYPLVPDQNGVKIVPELMEKEKMYYCLQNEKILLVYKDDQDFLNCYEVEEKDIVESVKQCKTPDEIEKTMESYLEKLKSQALNKSKKEGQQLGQNMSEQDKPTEAEEIFAESQKLKETPDETATPQATAAQPSSEERDEDSAKKTRDVIFVGTKPIMTYVTATLTQLSTQPVVTIKARGQRITQAVDVSQMIVKRMNTVGYQIRDVRIASDSLLSQDGKTRNVSTIEIDIAKA